MAHSFRFDPNLCTGCAACRLACTIENGLPFGRSWRRIETFNPMREPDRPLYHLSLACNHCDQPACMHACPALAYRRDTATGAVVLDPGRCIGCKYCAWACPYDAPVFDVDDGVMSKCTFCNHRLVRGEQPACVTLCPTGALGFADLEPNETTQAVPALPPAGLGPRIRVEPLRRARPPVDETGSVIAPAGLDGEVVDEDGISLRSEWSLMLFTGSLALLVAWVTARVSAGRAVPPLGFAAAAVATLALASAHLGRKTRAWRAALNLRRSWLSREVVAVSLFLAVALGQAALGPGNRAAGWAAAGLGFVALFCADRVYTVLGPAVPRHLHSAGLLGSGIYLSCVLARAAWPAAIVGGAKLLLYLARKRRRRAEGRPWRPAVGVARIALGFALPAALWSAAPGTLWAIGVTAAVLGEWLDRAEFYEEIERRTPRRTLAARSAGEPTRGEAGIPGA